MADELEAVVRRLLAVRPGEFVAERTAASRAARPEDRARATVIGSLRKPTPAAWVVNLLAGQGALDDAVDLGPRLRDAQASADPRAIRRLRAERRALVESLVRTGAELAEDTGHAVAAAVLAQVGATIEAGMADPWAGTAIRSGLLVRPLESVGFDRVDLAGAIAVPGAIDLPEPDDDAPDPSAPDAPDPSAPDAPDRSAPEPARGGRGRTSGVSRAGRERAAERAEQERAAQERAAQERAEQERAEQERADRARREQLAQAERAEAEARSRAEAADGVVADLERQLREATRAADAAHGALDAAITAAEQLTGG
ncbi:hypothetical protein [Curtobacterium sp. RRHDQ10]|uniref:hypothetical protein n=1 Tax=Curtobacterium phyllosphaerae TaxID=3413379 RepID=UPI003BF08AE8